MKKYDIDQIVEIQNQYYCHVHIEGIMVCVFVTMKRKKHQLKVELHALLS